MERVFENLLGNALDAMPDGGSIRISLIGVSPAASSSWWKTAALESPMKFANGCFSRLSRPARRTVSDWD